MRRARGLGWNVRSTVGLAAVVLGACGLPAPGSPTPATSDAWGGDTELLSSDILALVPDDVELYLALASPDDWASLMDLGGLLRRHDALAARWSRESLRAVVRDLFTIDHVAAVGLDPHKPFGVALLDADRDVLCVIAAVGDESALDAWLADLATRHDTVLERDTLGVAAIVESSRLPGVVLVRRAGHLAVVMGDTSRDRLLSHARSIAETTRDKSLLGSTQLRELAPELGRGALIAAYVKSPTLLQRWLGIWDRGSDPVFGSFRGAVVGVYPVGDHLEVQGFIGLREDSLIDRSLGTPRALPTWHDGAPDGVSLSASFRRELVGELLQGVFGTTGDPEAARAYVERELGLGLEADLEPHLDGGLGVVLRPRGSKRGVDATTVAATLVPGHDVGTILAGRRRPDPTRPPRGALRSVWGGTAIAWSASPTGVTDPFASDLSPDPSRARALTRLQHRRAVAALSLDAHALAGLGGGARVEALLVHLGLVTLSAERTDGGLAVAGAVQLEASGLSDYAERVVTDLEASRSASPDRPPDVVTTAPRGSRPDGR